MRIASATLSVAALLAVAAPALADATGSSTFWDNMRRQPSERGRAPYALTGEGRRARPEDFRACTAWIGGGRDRRVVYKVD